MPTKPTIIPTWATDTNYTSGPANGTPTKVDASALQAQGWKPGDEPGAQNFNWWKNAVGQWVSFLNPLFGNNGLVVPSQTRWEPVINNSGAQNANVTSINWNVGLLATANAAQAYFPSVIDLRPGDRVTALHAQLVGDGTVQNVTCSLYSFGAGGRSLIGTVTAVDPPVYSGGPVQYDTTGLTYTLDNGITDAGLFWDITMPHRTGSSTAVYSVGITFDRLNG